MIEFCIPLKSVFILCNKLTNFPASQTVQVHYKSFDMASFLRIVLIGLKGLTGPEPVRREARRVHVRLHLVSWQVTV